MCMNVCYECMYIGRCSCSLFVCICVGMKACVMRSLYGGQGHRLQKDRRGETRTQGRETDGRKDGVRFSILSVYCQCYSPICFVEGLCEPSLNLSLCQPC